MATNYIQDGKILNYTPSGSSVVAGAVVVMGNIAGIALTDIADGATGAVQIKGIFSLPKAAGAITLGTKLYWDSGNSNLTTIASGNTVIGVAASAQTSADTNVNLLLNVVN
jgi:predicted RecA/RadA family phage recombinase